MDPNTLNLDPDSGFCPNLGPDPYKFFADPDPAILLNADPDPTTFQMWIRIQLNKICNKLPYEELKKT